MLSTTFGDLMTGRLEPTTGITFVTGGSGFIGSRIIQASTTDIRALVHKRDVESDKIDRVYGNLLTEQNQFGKWIDGVRSVIHSARPSSGNAIGRYWISRRTRKATGKMISAIKNSNISSTIVLHGSLSYGNRDEDLVSTNSELNPIGYSKAYSIGEKPWLDYLDSGGDVKIVRAPWVIGPGSWFDMLYRGDIVPVVEGGSHWMSLVSVESLADFTWSIVDARPGVYHPPLLYRCRQSEFANLVGEIRGMETTEISSSDIARKYGKMVSESISSSIRIDDGNSMVSESEYSNQSLRNYLISLFEDSKT